MLPSWRRLNRAKKGTRNDRLRGSTGQSTSTRPVNSLASQSFIFYFSGVTPCECTIYFLIFCIGLRQILSMTRGTSLTQQMTGSIKLITTIYQHSLSPEQKMEQYGGAPTLYDSNIFTFLHFFSSWVLMTPGCWMWRAECGQFVSRRERKLMICSWSGYVFSALF